MKRQRKTLIGSVAILALAVVAASAYGVQLKAGDLIITAHGGFAPKALPKTEDAPIALHGGGKLSTVSGDLPPILQTISIEFDRHGSVQTVGLPVCRPAQLQSTTVAAARRACLGAIVGKGFGRALIAFPEQAPIPVSSPLTIFNGPPAGRNPTVLAHAHTTIPVPTTFVVPVVIERINRGVYGYRTKARIPKIAGGSGIPISGRLKIDRKWTYKGRRYSYVNARCEVGRLQARGEFTFDDGTFLIGTFLRPCTVRK